MSAPRPSGAPRSSCPHCGKRNRVPAAADGSPKCGNCHQPAALDRRRRATTTSPRSPSRRPVPVLVDLWATWCGPCRMVSPALERLATERAGELKLVKVDVDQAPRLAQRFEVQAVPTLMVLRDGEVLARQPGAAPRAARCALAGPALPSARDPRPDDAIPVGADPHLAFVRDDVVPRTPQGCEECLRIGSPWVHLRLCLTCGHVGCCDSSPNRHARAARRPGRPSDRPVVRAGRGLALVLRRRGV